MTCKGGTIWPGSTKLQAYHLIRRVYTDPANQYTIQQLADIFRVSQKTIHRIVTYTD